MIKKEKKKKKRLEVLPGYTQPDQFFRIGYSSIPYAYCEIAYGHVMCMQTDLFNIRPCFLLECFPYFKNCQTHNCNSSLPFGYG